MAFLDLKNIILEDGSICTKATARRHIQEAIYCFRRITQFNVRVQWLHRFLTGLTKFLWGRGSKDKGGNHR